MGNEIVDNFEEKFQGPSRTMIGASIKGVKKINCLKMAYGLTSTVQVTRNLVGPGICPCPYYSKLIRWKNIFFLFKYLEVRHQSQTTSRCWRGCPPKCEGNVFLFVLRGVSKIPLNSVTSFCERPFNLNSRSSSSHKSRWSVSCKAAVAVVANFMKRNTTQKLLNDCKFEDLHTQQQKSLCAYI